MSQILKDYTNDVIDETSEELDLINGKTTEDVNNIKESYKYIFTGFSVFIGFIITMISSLILDFSIGIIILFFVLITVLILLLKRQQRIRKLHEASGEYISVLSQKKSAFIKIRKQINYWENIRPDSVVTKDDHLTPKTIRNTLHALEIIDYSYRLYKIGIYEKLFPVVHTDTKAVVFIALLHHIKKSIETTKELVNIQAKPLPFYIHDEINRIVRDNKKYIPENFKESLSNPNYEVYINSKEFVDICHGGGWNLIRKQGLKKYSKYIQEIKPYEFLLDENLAIVEKRLKNK